MKYVVHVREVHVQQVAVEASSPDEAKQRVAEGEGDYLDGALEYSHTSDPEIWTVGEA